MATSNRERIDQGLQLVGQGLKPFVESVMAPAAQGRDWVEVLDARNNAAARDALQQLGRRSAVPAQRDH